MTAPPATPARHQQPRRSPLGLGPLETAIMSVLWRTDKWVTVPEIQQRIDYPPSAYRAIGSVLRGLEDKGLLHSRLGKPGDGPPWQYRAANPAHVHIGNVIAALLDHSPNPAAALKHALTQPPTANQR